MKSLLSSSVRLATLGLTAATAMAVSHSAVAEVEVSASAGVASAYLFRGVDQGPGQGAIFGDLTASMGGSYASVWATSGTGGSTEYDLIIGHSLDVGDFTVDVGAVNYMYPADDSADSFGDSSEVYVNVSLGVVTLSFVDNVAGATDYEYYSISAEHGAFSAVLGYSDTEDKAVFGTEKVDLDYTHLDLSYAYNDSLSFTVSQIVDLDEDNNGNRSGALTGADALDDDLLFVVSYSLPIK